MLLKHKINNNSIRHAKLNISVNKLRLNYNFINSTNAETLAQALTVGRTLLLAAE